MQGLESFSHVEVLLVFDQFPEPDEYRPLPQRGRSDLPAIGVFAARGPRRPNRIGVTCCRSRPCADGTWKLSVLTRPYPARSTRAAKSRTCSNTPMPSWPSPGTTSKATSIPWAR
ncbi:TrmO family methyltransferase [Streptomyces sp. CB01635]|uniref:TrmO family methyltransferase domain-containing protein n=1 Tax=unclassified Streptomyces TaxID=2593676 RepID=UPI001F264810|nr:TrmO family methyltransferase [Streptomyces sp. CB01635]